MLQRTQVKSCRTEERTNRKTRATGKISRAVYKKGQAHKRRIHLSFKTSLNPLEIPAATATWKVLGRDQHVNIPKVDDSTIREYQQAKFAGGKGQYRKVVKANFISLSAQRRTFSFVVYQSEHSKILYE